MVRWQDYQHQLTTDWNLFSFPRDRWMELGMSDDRIFSNRKTNSLWFADVPGTS
jgi:hypothetical protein